MNIKVAEAIKKEDSIIPEIPLGVVEKKSKKMEEVKEPVKEITILELPGVGAAVVLSLGRAVGETMAVLMVTGNSLQIPYTLFDPTYVMTSIITNQLGYAFVFPLWRSALFAVGLVLMIMSICFTLTAKWFIRYGMKTRGLI